MNLRLGVGIAALLILILVAIGCMQTQQPDTTTNEVSQATMTPFLTPVQTTITPSEVTTDSVTPEPTGALPNYWSVNVQATSNGQAINPQILMTFRGGLGMSLIPKIVLKVIRSDGVIENGEMDQPLHVGQTVVFNATTGYQDRAEAWAITPQGDSVKIFDQYVPFRSYNS